MEKGGLQPEFLAVWNWSSLFVEKMQGNEHLVLDGTPRKLDEAEVLDSAMRFYGREKPFVIFLDVSKEFSITRFLKIVAVLMIKKFTSNRRAYEMV